MGWLWAVLLQTSPLAGPLITFLYPLVASIMAIETGDKKDDQLWMMYWIIYALMSTIELIAAPVIAWIPFYAEVKLVIVAWLVLPQFRGSVVLYKMFVHPYFSTTTKFTITNGERKWSTNISADANESAAVYIKTNGLEAFEELMKSATKNIKAEEVGKIEVEEIRRLF